MKDRSTMDFEKDYYADLGVLPDVSKEVIRAVFLALAKRFHPDSGGVHADQEKFKTINTAYEILYDEDARREYDDGRTTHERSSYNSAVDDEEELFDDELAENWKLAVEHYPDLENLRKEVSAISSTLSVVFQSTILSNKNFSDAAGVKVEIIELFVERYFGKNTHVKNFALKTLKIGRRDAAKELNRAVLVFGDKLDPKSVIMKIMKKFDIVDDSPKEAKHLGLRIELSDFLEYSIYRSHIPYTDIVFSSIAEAKSYIDRKETFKKTGR
jgi:curved DNA-binding protein CbpA